MILVILPLGKEAKDIWSWVVRVVMYTAASTVGAGLLALLLGLIGRGLYGLFPGVPLEWAVAVLGVISIVYALHELSILHLPNPQIGWQVPKSWQRPGRLFGNTAYGVVLGAGIFTFIPFGSFYVLLAWEMVAGAVSLQAAVLLGMIYGLSRGVPVVMGGISMLRDVYPLPISHWLIDHLGWWHAINGLMLLVVGGFLLGSFVL